MFWGVFSFFFLFGLDINRWYEFDLPKAENTECDSSCDKHDLRGEIFCYFW